LQGVTPARNVLLSDIFLIRVRIILLKERSLTEYFFLVSIIGIAVIRLRFFTNNRHYRLLVISCDHICKSLSLTAVLPAQRLIDQQSFLLTQLFTLSRVSLDTFFQLADLLVELRDLLCMSAISSPPFISDFGKIPDDNIIAQGTALCLLAVRMNFGVSDEFCVRQIVMGNLF
jgi:hypothetical protein